MMSVKKVRQVGDALCPYCGGEEGVGGVVDDIEFFFRCPCSGGSEGAVRWLLGLQEEPLPGEDWTI